MLQQYQAQGFVYIEQLFSSSELAQVVAIANEFHSVWLRDNADSYQRGAINSAYLTNSSALSDQANLALFDFVSSAKLVDLISSIIVERPCFLNTQLFFNPKNAQQKNYWHRDMQFSDLNESRQKRVLRKDKILHFRIALADEPGLELVAGSHQRWDTAVENQTRLNQQGRQAHDHLPDATIVPMKKGDGLIFSANMLHRGLYGMQRQALDILYCEAKPSSLAFASPQCLPCELQLKQLQNPQLFRNSLTVMAQV